MDSVANVSIAVESVEKVLRDRLRLRMSIMGRLHDAAFMASVAGKPDDNMSSLLQAMIKAATIFVADREDRANLDKDDVIGALEKRLQESQRNRVSVNDSLLSVLGEALQYALEHWPREDLNRTSFRVDASVQCEIPSKDILDDEVVDHLIAATADEAKASTFPPQVESSLESIERENGQAILSEDGTEERILPAEETGLRNLTRDSVSDHPINNADEEKAFPFRATAEFSQEPIVRENEQTFPSEDKVVEGLLCAEETRLRGLNRDSVQYSNEHVPVKEESSVDAEMTDNCTEEKDYGMEDEEYAPSSEEVGEENERMVQPGAGAGSPCHKTAVEKWPGKDLKEVIDHPIDNVNEEKGVPFLSSIDISREPIERENEQAIPMPYSFIDLPIATAEEDKSFPFLPHADFPQEPFPSENHAEGGHWAGSIEETGLKNLTLASAQSPANGHDPVYEENCGDMEMTYYCTEENDYGVDNKVYAPSSEERERMVPPGAVADFPCRNNTVEKWPRENLKEVIDHPIRTTDEVKIIPFLPPTGFLEESGRRNLIPDRVHAAHENGAVAEKHGEGMDIVTDSTGSEHDVLTLDSDDDEHSSNGPKFTVEIGTPNEPFHTRRTLTSRDVATLDDESYINDEIVNLGLARVKAK